MHDQLQPTTERYSAIDILRGLALLGVLLVNLEDDFRVPLLEHVFRHPANMGMADRIAEWIVFQGMAFKAVTIFTFLFGMGIAIQSERASARQASARKFLARRMGWLLVFGAAHLFLIWNGDILMLYAVCGFLLLPFIGLRWQALLALGAAAIVLPEFVGFGVALPSGEAADRLIADAQQFYGHGGYLANLQFRWREAGALIVPILVGFLPRTLGLMFWGMAAWKSGIVRNAGRHRRALSWGLAVGAVGGIAITTVPALHHWSILGPLLLALAWSCGVFLWNPQWRGLAAVGQMAFTNYVMQSVVLSFVFYGFGLGLMGRMGPAAAAGVGTALYVAQVVASRMWLARFRFGPLEWLWRCLSYGKRQALVR